GKAYVPGGRRQRRDARLVPGQRLPCRIRRSRGNDIAGGVGAALSTFSVIASAAKKSSVFPRRDSGLLRRARNDGVEATHRFSGGTSRILAQCAATSSRLYFRCTRLSDAACLVTQTPGRHSRVGRIGRGTKPPPQFGQTLKSLASTQSAQNVHS